MRKAFLITVFCHFYLFSISQAQNQERKYSFDLNKSVIKWVVSQGEDEYTGTLRLKENGYILMNDKTLSQVVVFVDSKSIECVKCGNEEDSKKLIKFIKSSKFLNVMNMDYAAFKMLNQEALTDSKDGNFNVEGSLSIKGYTNNVSFPVFLELKKEKIMAKGSIPLNRMLWNLKDPVEEDGKLIYHMDAMVQLYFNLEGMLVK